MRAPVTAEESVQAELDSTPTDQLLQDVLDRTIFTYKSLVQEKLQRDTTAKEDRAAAKVFSKWLRETAQGAWHRELLIYLLCMGQEHIDLSTSMYFDLYFPH
jgi:propanediol dehydratase small subunit